MNKAKLRNEILNGLLMAAIVAAALPFPDLAWAQDLGSATLKIKTGIASMPQVVSGVSYIAGAALSMAGLVKLKAHSENPTQTPMGHGLGRLGAGAALLALPSLGTFVQTSIGLGSTPANYYGFSTIN